MTDKRFDLIVKAVAAAGSRRKALTGLLAGALSALAGGAPSVSGGRGCNDWSERRIIRIIEEAADRYGQSRKAMVRVARCESNLDPCAVNRDGPYYGLFQFLRSTWRSTPYADKDIFDPRANANAAAWMWKKGRRDEWACR